MQPLVALFLFLAVISTSPPAPPQFRRNAYVEFHTSDPSEKRFGRGYLIFDLPQRWKLSYGELGPEIHGFSDKQFFRSENKGYMLYVDKASLKVGCMNMTEKSIHDSICSTGKYMGVEFSSVPTRAFVHVWHQCNFGNYLLSWFPQLDSNFTVLTSIYDTNEIFAICYGEMTATECESGKRVNMYQAREDLSEDEMKQQFTVPSICL